MGIGKSKSIPLPLYVILKRCEEATLPEDRETIVDLFEMIENVLYLSSINPNKSLKPAVEEFKELEGVMITVGIMKKCVPMEDVIRVGVGIYDLVKDNIPIIMDFIEYGGVDLLDKIKRVHERDEVLAFEAPKLLTAVLAIGANAAINEIKAEGLSLQLCQKCQEALQRSRRAYQSDAVVKVPRSCDRMNRIVMFMENYPTKVDVLSAGLDAVILFCNNPDSKMTIHETTVIKGVCKVYRNNPKQAEVVWRVCFGFSALCKYSDLISVLVLKEKICELMAGMFSVFDDNPQVQQQILWMFNSMLMHHKAKTEISQSSAILRMFEGILKKKKELLKKKIIKDEDKYAPYIVVLPLLCRTVLRETGGSKKIDGNKETQEEEEDEERLKNKKQHKKRRNFDDKPKYGTVKDKHFQDGEKGLNEAEVVVLKDSDTPWEAHLNKGSGFQKENKKKLINASGNVQISPEEQVETKENVIPKIVEELKTE